MAMLLVGPTIDRTPKWMINCKNKQKGRSLCANQTLAGILRAPAKCGQLPPKPVTKISKRYPCL